MPSFGCTEMSLLFIWGNIISYLDNTTVSLSSGYIVSTEILVLNDLMTLYISSCPNNVSLRGILLCLMSRNGFMSWCLGSIRGNTGNMHWCPHVLYVRLYVNSGTPPPHARMPPPLYTLIHQCESTQALTPAQHHHLLSRVEVWWITLGLRI